MQRYIFFHSLGRGTFGVVYKAYDKILQKDVAIKQIAKTGELISRETDILQRLTKSEHCISILDVFFSFTNQLCEFIVCDYMPYTLKDFIYKNPLEKSSEKYEKQAKNIIQQILKGLLHIHSLNIVHRDLKPENILINDFLNPELVKICDFGSAKLCEEANNNPYVVSSFYRAPELIFGCVSYGVEVDLWALGCIVIEMFWQRPAFYCCLESELFAAQLGVLQRPDKEDIEFFAGISGIGYEDLSFAIKNASKRHGETKKLAELSTEICDFALKLLKWDPKKRIQAKDALSLLSFN